MLVNIKNGFHIIRNKKKEEEKQLYDLFSQFFLLKESVIFFTIFLDGDFFRFKYVRRTIICKVHVFDKIIMHYIRVIIKILHTYNVLSLYHNYVCDDDTFENLQSMLLTLLTVIIDVVVVVVCY